MKAAYFLAIITIIVINASVHTSIKIEVHHVIKITQLAAHQYDPHPSVGLDHAQEPHS